MHSLSSIKARNIAAVLKAETARLEKTIPKAVISSGTLPRDVVFNLILDGIRDVRRRLREDVQLASFSQNEGWIEPYSKEAEIYLDLLVALKGFLSAEEDKAIEAELEAWARSTR